MSQTSSAEAGKKTGESSGYESAAIESAAPESPVPPEASRYMQAEGVSTSGDAKRQTWSNGIQFLLTCISFAVGLGNIWRFPALVYENGGGTFLIPYICCSMIIGFPVLYLELSLGQFARKGPSVVYGKIKPFFHGVGWTMVFNSFITAVYYNMVVAWTLIYMSMVILNRSKLWMRCHNDFNSIYCQTRLEDEDCTDEMGQPAFFFNQTCYAKNDTEALELKNATFQEHNAVSPTEEFFDQFVLQLAPEAGEWQMNWMIVGAYFAAFVITAVAMYKGPKIIGKLSYVMAVLPYVIIAILFGRAVTLDGSSIGLHYYLVDFKWELLYNPKTWQAAATQVCFSLSPGFGGILSYATYNRRDHNVYRDAFIIASADFFMSVFGGTAVFCVLGYMSKALNVEINRVVKDGTALAFIAYPEALGWLPIPELWSFLFFLMLFLLGVSSEFGYVEAVITAFADQFPLLNRHKGLTTFGVCFICFIFGLPLCTTSGFYYFNLANDYCAGFSVTVCLLCESALIAHFYGLNNYVADLHSMFGKPRHLIGKVFGMTGYYVKFIWFIASPLLWFTITIATIYKQLYYVPSTGKGSSYYEFPMWLIGIGWVVSVIPFTTIPGFLLYNVYHFKRIGEPLSELWKCQPGWPSFLKHRPNDLELLKKESGISDEMDTPTAT
ncbi:unnamed protein product [Bursaphelenchus okinawaensis]|uniref:Transporter n=1 Tax=Bursaphelenchus okinawaensis TaxID=465554 RepID=A0A811JWA7_9BILA|nr:unnamed protein product [Bursaphelenchus okinawaensis]CAG9086032.1 unnamed protein product [Bursaphelenchus okinawaensis]